MAKYFEYLMRWLILLPFSFVAGLLATFPVHWILYMTLSGGENPIVTPYPEYPERILQPLFSSYTIIVVAHYLAPKYKYRTILILSIILILTILAFYFLSLNEVQLGDYKFYQKLEGVPMLTAIIGVVIGFYQMRSKQDDDQYHDIGEVSLFGRNQKLLATIGMYLLFFCIGILSFESLLMRKVYFLFMIVFLLFMSLFRLKERFTETLKQKVSLVSNLLLIVWLVIGFFNAELGFHVLIVLLALLVIGFFKILMEKV